jgi:Fe2+ or Zn2+ uptake regulation protein
MRYNPCARVGSAPVARGAETRMQTELDPRIRILERQLTEARRDSGGERDCGGERRTRNTQQRKAVLEAVRSLTGRHPTAAEVFEVVRLRQPRVSLATVYRALHALVQQNQVIEMRVENVARYDAGPCAHHHVVCRKCGTVVDVCAQVMPESLRAVLHALESASGFDLAPHPLQVSGLCPDCK